MAKGSDFEREVCKRLSLWWSKGARDDIFWRTAASGARATQRRKKGKNTKHQHGDLTFTDEIGKPLVDRYSIEMKTGYSERIKNKRITNWCVLDILDSHQKVPRIFSFWNQCCDDAEKSDREPLLIFRRPLMAPCIAMRDNHFKELTKIFEYPTICLWIVINSSTYPVHMAEESICIFALEDFLKWIPDIRPSIPTQIKKRRLL